MPPKPDGEDVTEDDLKKFDRSLLARRFPGLKALPVDQKKELVRAEKRKEAEKRSRGPSTSPKGDPAGSDAPPSTSSGTGGKTRQPPPPIAIGPERPRFAATTSLMGAKKDIARPHNEAYAHSFGTPYEGAAWQLAQDVEEDRKRELAEAPFVTSIGRTKAKMSIAANYYLSSPVEVGREEELRAVRSQAAANLAKFKQEYEGVRKGLVQAEEQKRKRREEQRC